MSKIFERGKGEVKFSKNDFASSGGEAKVYKKGNVCYKIFHSPSKMIPEAKIGELQTLNRDNIIKPFNILLNDKNTPIGFTSSWVEGIPMCKVFVTGFRKRNNITDDHTLELVKNIQDTIKYIHSKKCLIVDGNEMNYLVGNDFITPYFIDVNSWQTPSFPATALMDSIKDWEHENKFTELSDWYAFAVISCWLFSGIHPFRGNHPDYIDKDIHVRTKRRTLDRVSIFHPDVLLAPNVRISSIPSHYKEWYLRIFDKGERSLPPGEAGIIIAVPIDPTIIKGTDNFIIKELQTYKNDISWYAKIHGMKVLKTSESFYVNNKELKAPNEFDIIFSLVKQVPIFTRIVNKNVDFITFENYTIRDSFLMGSESIIIGNHVYIKSNDKLIEMYAIDDSHQNRVIPIVKHTWDIMPNSSELFAGVIYQNMLEQPYISIPVPSSNKASAMYTKKIQEIKDHKILDGKHDNHVVSLFTSYKGDYKVIILRFDKDYNKYDYREIKVGNIGDINMITLDNGVCIIIPENGILEVFGNKPFVNDVKSIHDPVITTDMRLCKDGTSAMFFKDKTLYSIRMNNGSK